MYWIAGRGRDYEVTLDSTFECIHPEDRMSTRARLLDAVRDRDADEREFRIDSTSAANEKGES